MKFKVNSQSHNNKLVLPPTVSINIVKIPKMDI